MSHRRSVRRPGHPLAMGAAQRVRTARFNLYEKLDGADADCHWCGLALVWLGEGDLICADHLDGDVLNDEPENLVPSCRGCNANRDRRRQPRSCPTCGEEFLPGRPESRYCSRACANRSH